MSMMIYGLTRKQVGVIFSNYKRGNLPKLNDEIVKFLYDHVADQKHYSDSHLQDVYDRARTGLEAIFEGDFEAAQESIIGSYEAFNIYYK